MPITDAGAELAKKISARIGGQVFCKDKDFDDLKNFVADIFDKFDALIFICAAGITVRIIAPHIVSKLSDPAVIVIDERGRNVISLLSGHVGGGNDLTLKIATAINSNPVITTATDIENKFAADSFAAKLGLIPTPKNAIKAINTAVLRDEEIYLTAGNVRLDLTAQKVTAAIDSVTKGDKYSSPARRKNLLDGGQCKTGFNSAKINSGNWLQARYFSRKNFFCSFSSLRND